jgi:hypothetical protein
MNGVRPRAVLAELDARGAQVVFANQHDALLTELELAFETDVEGRLRLAGGEWIDLAQIRAAYVRPENSRRLPAVERERSAGGDWRRAEVLEEGLAAWADMTSALVVNRPARWPRTAPSRISRHCSAPSASAFPRRS